jgi:hypothetical protein
MCAANVRIRDAVSARGQKPDGVRRVRGRLNAPLGATNDETGQ